MEGKCVAMRGVSVECGERELSVASRQGQGQGQAHAHAHRLVIRAYIPPLAGLVVRLSTWFAAGASRQKSLYVQ